MQDDTRILSQIEPSDPQGADELLPLVYDELRKLVRHRMAREATVHTRWEDLSRF